MCLYLKRGTTDRRRRTHTHKHTISEEITTTQPPSQALSTLWTDAERASETQPNNRATTKPVYVGGTTLSDHLFMSCLTYYVLDPTRHRPGSPNFRVTQWCVWAPPTRSRSCLDQIIHTKRPPLPPPLFTSLSCKCQKTNFHPVQRFS